MNPLDCLCGHPSHKHTVTLWPKILKFCEACGQCRGYEPLYKNQQGGK